MATVSKTREVFGGFRVAMEGMVTSPRDGLIEAPGKFVCLPSSMALAAAGIDRSFCVRNTRNGTAMRGVMTGLSGRAEYTLSVDVIILHINHGGDDESRFEAYLAEEQKRICDRVMAYFQGNNIAGVIHIEHGGFSVEADDAETIFLTAGQFAVRYRDSITAL